MFALGRAIAYRFPDPLREIPPYRPTFHFGGDYINATHAALATAPLRDGHLIDLGLAGWLRREDALKLYELSYYSSGDILELGSYQGLSSCVIASAVRDSGGRNRVVSVEVDDVAQQGARMNLERRGLHKFVSFRSSPAEEVCDQSSRERLRYGFVFVDHDHAYDSVLGVARRLSAIVRLGGFALFHDWLDSRNADADDPSYGVYQGTMDGLPANEWHFYGVFGVAGLFRRTPFGRLIRGRA